MKITLNDKLCIAAGCAVICALGGWGAVGLPGRSGLVPVICLIVIGLCGLCCLLEYFQGKGKPFTLESRVINAVGMFTIFIVLIEFLGLYASSGLFMVAIFLYTAGERKHGKLEAVIWMLAIVILIYVIFEKGLGTWLPRGIVFENLLY